MSEVDLAGASEAETGAVDVSTLEGVALDAAVARLEGWAPVDADKARTVLMTSWFNGERYELLGYLDFSKDWALGGPIIERERIEVSPRTSGAPWKAIHFDSTAVAHGPTPLIAAMRAFVASRASGN